MLSRLAARQAAAEALLKAAALLRARAEHPPGREKIASAGAVIDLAKLRKLVRP